MLWRAGDLILQKFQCNSRSLWQVITYKLMRWTSLARISTSEVIGHIVTYLWPYMIFVADIVRGANIFHVKQCCSTWKFVHALWRKIALHEMQFCSTWFALFWCKICFAVIYYVLTQNWFCRDIHTFVWRTNLPKSLVRGAKMTNIMTLYACDRL